MNEKEAVWRVVEVLREGLPDEVTVRTEGGGEFMELPCVIVSWTVDRADRLHGNVPFAGVERDENGNAISEVLHAYFEMRLDLWIKTYDDEPIRQSDEPNWGEEGRDDLVDMVHGLFVPFEYRSYEFHPDAFEFQVESVFARADPKQEPNWMEADQVVTFRYVKEFKQTDVDVLEDVHTTIDGIDLDMQFE